MKTLAELREMLRKHLAEIEAIKTKAFSDGATSADLDAMDKANETTLLIERQITARIAEEAAVARAALPLDTAAGMGHNGGPSLDARVKEKLSTEMRVGLLIKGLQVAHDQHIPLEKALEDGNYGGVIKELVTTTDSKGGVTVPEVTATEIITLLRPASAFVAGNPRRITLEHGNLIIPRQESGVSGGYIAEATDIPVEEPTLGSMDLSAKKLAVIVPISRELLTWSQSDMMAFVKGDIMAGLGQKMDLALLRGDGLNGAPLGIVNSVGINTFVANATVNIVNIEADLAKAEGFMAMANLPEVNRRWIMSPRTLIFLSSLRDGNGQLVYPTLSLDNPTLRRKPVLTTTQIPVNLGAGTNATEIYLVEFSEVFFAETPGGGMQFAISDEAMYKVGGVSYSAFQRDVTLVRAIMHHDTDIRRLTAVVKITGVTY
jgi:HK97 family phage major capsid protein